MNLFDGFGRDAVRGAGPASDQRKPSAEARPPAAAGERAEAEGPAPWNDRRLLDSAYDAVLLTDEAAVIVDLNQRATEVLGYDAARLRGAELTQFLAGGGGGLLADIRRRLAETKHVLLEGEVVRGNGTTVPVEIAASRVALGGSVGFGFFIRDIALRKRSQLALQDAVQRLQEHDRARLQFISNVSHELRTPLTSMIYAVNNLLAGVAGPVSGRVRRYLEILEGDGKRLLTTVNDILDLRKLETQTLTLVKTKVPFVRLVQRSVESLLVQAQQKSLSISLPPERGRWFVECDAQKMERVVLNVVGNAVKFTPEEGSIEIAVGDDPDRPGHVCLRVRDSGIGIPPEALGKVTLRYFTVGEQATGAGLGLAISKEIVGLHGGALDIRSPPPGFDKGTVVFISLPLARPPAVLVVEDDEGVRGLLAEQIAQEGYTVLLAPSGSAAEAMLAAQRPEVIVLDLVLPDADGTEFILKARTEAGAVPPALIVVTGAAISSSRREILDSFSIPTLGKPWDAVELMEALADVFIGRGVLGRRSA